MYYVNDAPFASGSFGDIHEAVSATTGEIFAAKKMDLAPVGREDQWYKRSLMALTECGILHALRGCPNVIGLSDGCMSRDKQQMHFFLEKAGQGDILDRISTKGALSDAEAAKHFTSLMGAVAWCHDLHVAHRDVKLENLLLTNDGHVKLCDFGLSTVSDENGFVTGRVGTEGYAAPEVWLDPSNPDRKYRGDAADIWSCGVCLFCMLTGYQPFHEARLTDRAFLTVCKAQQLGESTLEAIFNIYDKRVELSPDVAQLLEAMLQVNWRRRPTVSQILQCDWLKAHGCSPGAGIATENADRMHKRLLAYMASLGSTLAAMQ